RADAAYKSFPPFREWLASTIVDTGRWDRYARLLAHRTELTPELLARARDVAKRAAAIDTGAIEGLYEVDRGFTFSVAMQVASWESQLTAKGARIRSLIETQMEAYDFVLDFATQKVEIAEAWIRTLHEVMCRGQETYLVHTEIGAQEQALPLGMYKVLPNHVLKSDGVTHSYAPVELVPAEMHRLCSELRSPDFVDAHPVLQASYAHYGFVAIHPFADGNGRVARALASVFTYRPLSVPLLILAEHRLEYFAALGRADEGTHQPFVDFMLSRTLDSIQLVSDTLKAAGVPAPSEAAAQLKRVYLTRGGYTHGEVDSAGYRLFDAFTSELQRQTSDLKTPELAISFTFLQDQEFTVADAAYRNPLTGSRGIELMLKTSAPARAELTKTFVVQVPKDSGREDDLIIRNLTADEIFQARIEDAHPFVTGTLQLRLGVFVQGLLGRAIAEAAWLASETLRRTGY
ncbi:MAG TPA: Fic family protein, partial [Thermoanaerobaculia bacterium]